MKKILFLVNCPAPYRVRFFDILGRDADVTVLFWARKEEVTDRHADWFETGEGNFRQIQLTHRVTRLADGLHTDVIRWMRRDYDAIVIGGYSSATAALAMAYCRLHRIPFYIEVDGGLIRQESRVNYWIKKMLVGSATWWLSTGERTTEYLTHYGAKRERVLCYPFTSLEAADILSEPVGKEEKAELRKELNMEEEKIVLSIGQFIPRKGFDVLLKAAASLPKDTGVYIVGGEPTEEYLALARELSLTNVHFCGFKKKQELSKYYRAADLFVLPTREDIWGLVINEAMSFGLPTVTTDHCVAGLELIREGVNGSIVPVDDVAALADAIKKMLSSDMEKMGAAALETARQYTIENMAKAHLEIFESR